MKTISKKSFVVLMTAIGFILIGSLIYILAARANKTEFDVPFAFEDGFKAKIPIPKGSVHLRRTGLGVDEFKTKKSQEEVEQFYTDYFKGLKKVHSTNGSDSAAYYDADQQIVIIRIKFIHREDKKATYFTISYDKYYEDNWLIE